MNWLFCTWTKSRSLDERGIKCSISPQNNSFIQIKIFTCPYHNSKDFNTYKRVGFTVREYLNKQLVGSGGLIEMEFHTWKDYVASVIAALGGKARLYEIYDYVICETTLRLPDSWQAIIRYTIYIHSSDSRAYKGGEDLFYRLDRGYWGLR
jgi:hypothetical protein